MIGSVASNVDVPRIAPYSVCDVLVNPWGAVRGHMFPTPPAGPVANGSSASTRVRSPYPVST